MRPPRIIGFHSVKGGVGKSTLSVLCAFWAGREDGNAKQVVLIDADPWGDCLKFQQKRKKLELSCPFTVVPGEDFDLKNKVVRNLDSDLIIVDIPPRGVNAVGGILRTCDLIAIPNRVGGTEFDRLEEMFSDYDAAGLGEIPKILILNEIESRPSNLIQRWFGGGDQTLHQNLLAFAKSKNLPVVEISASLDYKRLMLEAVSPWEWHKKSKIKKYQSPKLFREIQILFDALGI